MKTAVVFTVCCLLLWSCSDHSIDKSKTRLPVAERHYNMETGELIAEKSFVYDHAGNLILENYKPLTDNLLGYQIYRYEINYEYDAQQNRVLMLTRHLGETELYSLARFFYDGDKKIEEQYFSPGVNAQRPHTKFVYYYSGNLVDSAVTFLIRPYDISTYSFGGASYFKYDDQQRLIEEQRRPPYGNLGVTALNNYDGDLLKETCIPVAGREGAFTCTRYEYNVQRNVIRKYTTMTGTADMLLEEHIYTEGLLTETKIFGQVISPETFSAEPTRYTLQIKYEY